MTTLRLILADQLSELLSSLREARKKSDIIMLFEVMSEATYVPHHPKKIAFLFSAMRHFAEELKCKGYNIRYIRLDDPLNTGSLDGEIKRAITELKPERIIVTEPGEWRMLTMMQEWKTSLGIPIEILRDDRFLCSISEFKKWATDKKQLRMEFFYREMRKKYGILMEKDNKPTGGEWNYDKENRKPPKVGIKSPPRMRHKKSTITSEVLTLVGDKFSHHFGKLEPFHYAVNREQALLELDDFIGFCLSQFGDYQDAMLAGESPSYITHLFPVI